MSKNSNKELTGVYKRCLSALYQNSRTNIPSGERVKGFEKKVSLKAVNESSKKHFSSKDEMEAWIEKRANQLYKEMVGGLFRDPNADLKEQIREILGTAE